jgi:hypothetical protein
VHAQPAQLAGAQAEPTAASSVCGCAAAALGEAEQEKHTLAALLAQAQAGLGTVRTEAGRSEQGRPDPRQQTADLRETIAEQQQLWSAMRGTRR